MPEGVARGLVALRAALGEWPGVAELVGAAAAGPLTGRRRVA